MGILRKLSFWRKSTSSVVQPFAQPLDDEVVNVAQSAKKSPAACFKISSESSVATSCWADELTTVPASGTLYQSQTSTAWSPARKSPSSSIRPKTEETSLREAAVVEDGSGYVADAALAAGVLEPRMASKLSPKEDIRMTSKVSPKEAGSDCPNFDAPLAEIYAGIAAEFGHMIATSLQSTKWDKRSQALKSISSVLKGLDLEGMAAPGSTGALGRGLRLRDSTRCWRLSCQVLNHVMRDKVIPVRLAALELYTDTFANAEGAVDPAEARYAAAVLIDHLFDRLGDSNLRLHESARKCILFSAERRGMLGLGAVLNRLRARLENVPKGGERTKVHFGVLDAVSVLLEHFPGHRSLDQDVEIQDVQTAADSWTVNSVMFFIAAGMDDSLGTRVRNSAVAIAVTVYKTFGAQAAEHMMKGLRPAKQTLLRKKFKEIDEEAFPDLGIEDEDGDEGEVRPDLDDLMICGSALKPVPAAVQLPGAMGEEECMMDGILEETGMVFNGTGIRFFSGQEIDFEEVGDETFLLEQELLGLGLDLDELEEQQALISELMMGEDHDSFGGIQNSMGSYPVNVF